MPNRNYSEIIFLNRLKLKIKVYLAHNRLNYLTSLSFSMKLDLKRFLDKSKIKIKNHNIFMILFY